jgi:hypothetical protein
MCAIVLTTSPVELSDADDPLPPDAPSVAYPLATNEGSTFCPPPLTPRPDLLQSRSQVVRYWGQALLCKIGIPLPSSEWG